MLKIKIVVCATIVWSLFICACSFNAANGGAQTVGNQKQTEQSLDLSARKPKTASATQKDAGETRFKGSVGEAEFEMALRRTGDQLAGSYFYVKSGSANELVLRGEIEADGKFILRETDSSGKQTGEFRGIWKDDANEAGATLEGDWKKPNAGGEGKYFLASEQVILFTGGRQIINKQINESIKAKRFEANAAYPELTGGANFADFNQTIKTRVENSVADFKKAMLETTAEDLKTLPEDSNSYIEIGYNIAYADNDLVSINFWQSQYEGGVHPNTDSDTINYDLKNKKELKLAELFKPGAKYLEVISAHVIKDLQSRKMPETGENMGIAQGMWQDGALPTVDNYQNWNITKKGLLFTFPPYQVAPYAAGPQYVIVPYAQLKTIAKPDGALAKFIK